MNKYAALTYPLLSGLLLWASWPVSPFTFLIFIAWVPFLWIEQDTKRGWRYFYQVYLMLLVWNAGTTWWVCNSTVPGGIAAIVANSFLMSLPWLAYFQVRKRLGQSWAYAALVAFWLSFEYIHLNWQLSWPWLTLGNAFASHPGWVQWYEYTGTTGGSLWVMLVNVLVVRALRTATGPGKTGWKKWLRPAGALLLPLLVSWGISASLFFPASATSNVVVVQPNIDPYQKFEAGMQDAQLQKMLRLSEEKLDPNTVLVVWPETALNLPNGIEENRLHEYPSFMPLWNFLKAHPRVKLLTGVESYRLYTEASRTPTARATADASQFFDSFNTAALLDSTGAGSNYYHKSKLVPGVETLPTYLRFLDSWFEQFGGTGSGYTAQTERSVLEDKTTGLRIAPAICYESIYGEFMTAYIRNGANVISIITNDGWWSNTSGHKQHKEYARLRAIETRRWVLRSANTGISCFIAPNGDLFEQQPWDTAAAAKSPLVLLHDLTFYVRFGDLISKIALTGAVAIILLALYQRFRRKTSA